MTIREIEEKDYTEFEELFCNYYEELDCEDDPCHLFDEYVLPDLRQGLFSVAVGLNGNDICGFIIYQTDRPENEWCFKEGAGDLRELYVAPAHRGKGIGKALIKFAESNLAVSGAKCVYALPTEGTEGFFVNCGYCDNGGYCEELDNKVLEKLL